MINVQHGLEVEPERVRWLWRPYIPFGMLTTIVGDPGAGKTWLACKLSADLSAGRPLPGMSQAYRPQKVLFATADDSIKHTIAPRMKSLGADMGNIYYIEDQVTLDKKGLKELEDLVASFAVTFLVIDPIIGFFGDGGKDMNKGSDVRPLMGGLKQIAERTGTAIVVIRHKRKGSADSKGPAIYDGSGSIDFVGSARSEIHVSVAHTGPGEALMKHVKSNISALGPPKGYHFWSEDDNSQAEGHFFEWLAEAPSEYEVPKSSKALRAAEWIRAYLTEAGAAVPAKQVYEAGEEAGFTVKLLKEAKKGIAESVKTSREGGWDWVLV